MTLLARLLQFLRFLEGLLDFFEFLATPLGGNCVGRGHSLRNFWHLAVLDSSLSATLAGVCYPWL